MSKTSARSRWIAIAGASASMLAGAVSLADVVTDWNEKTCEFIVAEKAPPPAAVRTAAIVQSAVMEAVDAALARDPAQRDAPDAPARSAIDAAVATASHATLSALLPSQQAAIETAYKTALTSIPDGAAKTNGIADGERAAATVLASRADDGASAPESYRPRTAPGVYVPTALPAGAQWPGRKPWAMATADQFRPGPPPDLASDVWARDYNEIKAIGARNSKTRSAEQTDIARFWEATGPAIYFPIVRSVAYVPGRDAARNARLLAAAAQAMDDALIGVFDAKYAYEFWRPITAIRNGDMDGNDATERDASWLPFIDTPMHPEYPCAHCIVAAAIGAVMRADIGSAPTPVLSGTSLTAPGMMRTWTSIEDFVTEVSNARIYDGVHFRTSTAVGSAMGAKIGELVAAKVLAAH